MTDEQKAKPQEIEAEDAKEEQPAEEIADEHLDEVSGGTSAPRDPASGLPTGQRMHKPYTFSG